MSQNLATINAPLPAFLQNLPDAGDYNELEQNVRGSYAIVSVKGKVFAVKFGGETQQVLNEQGYPAQYLDVVIVSANPNLTKTYYATTFTDDSAERPDCWSEDGVTPAAPNPANNICATCPKNQFGSRISDNGSKGKACSDTRKLVIVPATNITNESFGGGMMLRVSPTGLQDLANYNKKLRSGGAAYFAVVTRLSFDSTLAYPKLTFTPMRYLTEAEFAQVQALRDDEHTNHILNSVYVEATPADDFSTGIGAPPAHIAPPAAPAPAPEAPKRTRTRTAPAPAELPQPATAAPATFVAPAATAVEPAPVTNAQVTVPEDLSAKLSGLFG
jgi:hypothetical protein